MPLRFQIPTVDRLTELALGQEGVSPEERVGAAELGQPDRGRQVERCFLGRVSGKLALDEDLGNDELVFGHELRLRYSPEPVNGNRPRFEC